MRSAEPRWCVIFAAGVWIALATPAARQSLESTMGLHMLVQLPLLAAAGYSIGYAWLHARDAGGLRRALRHIQSWNEAGVTGLVIVGFVMVFWMLPRFLDMARLDAVVDAVKFASVPAAGLLLAMSWPRCPSIARAVVHIEIIATLLRFGWGYLAAEERLCLAYLADDQQRVGTLLLWLGGAYAVAVAWRPVFGTRHSALKQTRSGLAAMTADNGNP